MPDVRVVKLTGPAEVTSMSVGGVELPVIDGMIEVPEVYETELLSHGFVRYIAPPVVEKQPVPPMAKSARKGSGEDKGY